MLELTWVSDAFRLFGVLYWAVALFALMFALATGKTVKATALRVLIVVALFGYFPAKNAWEYKQIRDVQQAARDRFQMRCKTAGERIYKTADNVEGILLLKVRSKLGDRDLADQMWPEAAFGREWRGDSYILSFLLYEQKGNLDPARRNSITSQPTSRPGYRYVDVIDPADGQRYRYTVEITTKASGDPQRPFYSSKLVREVAPAEGPRYGVTFEDVPAPEDRKLWVAGNVVKVIDLKTNEVMGELIRYSVDLGQGDTSGGRSPWLNSHICPTVNGHPSISTRWFVDQVLKPRQGE